MTLLSEASDERKNGANFNRALLIAARYRERAAREFPGNVNDRHAAESDNYRILLH